MTQSVVLTQPVRVGGSVLAAGTTQTLARDIAADLVARGFANTVGRPVWVTAPGSSRILLATSNIPFLIMPGDGSANGCQFTGSAGAFTLSATILSGLGTSLEGCYAYFSANFGGATIAAGWYWTEFSSETAGIVYSNTYSSGIPRRPDTKTPITTNLSGWVTASTNEITAVNSILLPAGYLGKNGVLGVRKRLAGSTTGNKTYRLRAANASTTLLVMFGTTASPFAEYESMVVCIDSHTKKINPRNQSSGPAGIGIAGGSFSTELTSSTMDTSVDNRLDFTLQGSTNLAAPILLSASIDTVLGST